jgi:hypothetical protein
MKILEEGFAGGARATEMELLVGMRTTLPRRRRKVANSLSEEERQRILLTYNKTEFAALSPGQIVPVLADRGLYRGQNAVFTRCSPPTVWPIGAVEQGLHRNQGPCHASEPWARLRSGAGTSPICPPLSGVYGSSSTWCSTLGAARLSPGMSPNARTLPSQPTWGAGLASASGSARAESSP